MSFLFRPPPAQAIAETDYPAGYAYADPIDPGAYGYRTLGLAHRDLNPQTLHRAMDMCVGLYRSNPIAHRSIRILTSYLAGDGYELTSTSPEVEAVLADFEKSPRNRLDRHGRSYARDWLLMGEAPHPVATDEMGNTTLGYIDPTTIDRVERSPLNNMILERIIVKDGTGKEYPLEIAQTVGDASDPAAGLLKGDVLFYPLDRIAASTRGTPYLLPSLDWLDAYDQILWEMLERQKALRAFFWDAKVEGDENDLIKVRAQVGDQPPKTGSVRWHTAAVDYTAVSPNLGTGEDVAGARYQLRHLATGVGLPPHWLSDPEDANRSTAERMDIPAMRQLSDLQAEWQYNVTEMATFALHQKVIAGMLKRTVDTVSPNGTTDHVPVAEAVQVTVPAITHDDIAAGAQALAQTVQAFVQLDMLGQANPAVVNKVVRTLLPALGVPLDELPDEDATPQRMSDFVEALAGDAEGKRIRAFVETGDVGALQEALARYAY